MPAETPRERSDVPFWAVLGYCSAAVTLSWLLSGIHAYHGPDHMVGPFHVSVVFEWSIGAISIAVAVAGFSTRSRRPTRTVASLDPTTVKWLVVASVVAAMCWRVATAGGDGANIGGGLVWVTGPAIITGLLVTAGMAGQNRRKASRRRRRTLMVLVALAAPLLYLFEYAVIEYDNATGVITAEQYASVHPGQPENDVRQRLGRPGEPIDWFFAAPPPGSHCTYYEPGSDQPKVFRVCFRNGTVLRKDLSREPYAYHHP